MKYRWTERINTIEIDKEKKELKRD